MAAATPGARRQPRTKALRHLALPLLALLLRSTAFLPSASKTTAAPSRLLQPGQSASVLVRDAAGPQQPQKGRTAAAAGGSAGGAASGTALLLAVLSSFFNGTFPAFGRLPAGPALDPVLFNGLVCCGVFISSLLVPPLAGVPWLFTAAGLCGGVLFVFAALFSFVAIPRAGLATAQAVWSCSAILVSFAWGAFGPPEIAEPVKDLSLSGLALLLLVAGALVIVNCDAIAAALGQGSEEEEAEGESKASDKPTGILCALAVGLFGGSVLVPLKFVPPEAAGLVAAPSFGLGALLAGIAVTLGYWKGVKGEEGLPQAAGDAVLAGLASGCVWNAGNICSIVAQSPPYSLPYGIAYPILQCALFFGGLLGIFAFGEIRGAAVAVFWGGAAALAAGIVALSSYGPGA